MTVTAELEAWVLPIKEFQSLPMSNQTPEKKGTKLFSLTDNAIHIYILDFLPPDSRERSAVFKLTRL